MGQLAHQVKRIIGCDAFVTPTKRVRPLQGMGTAIFFYAFAFWRLAGWFLGVTSLRVSSDSKVAGDRN